MTSSSTFAWPTRGLSYGGDYNPEQWPREVWQDDVRLMREAGVNIVSLGIFAWAAMEPESGRYEWEWLDEIIALLAEHGVAVDLATPTAAPPQWLLAKHPEILPVDADLRQQWPGARLGWCPSSPVFREYALRIATALAERYGAHPAVRLWHVSNELGGGNGRCYCDVSAQAFRHWLEARYETTDRLNEAWGTPFWGHLYSSFEQVLPPRGSGGAYNPGLELDFQRFSSDELLAHYQAEKAAIEQYSDVPVTTNFMVNRGPDVVDYPRWAEHVAVVANDHYTIGADPFREEELAFAADRMRGVTREREPWLLMEHSTSGVVWQPRNRAKSPGEMARNSLTHVARGSDGALFFQWRASDAGAEQFHSGMVPHAGTDSKVWREVVELGAALRALEEIQGSRVEPARVAVLFEDEAAWAFSRGMKPSNHLTYADQPRLWHRAFWNRSVLVDVIPPWKELDGYDLVIVPNLYLVSDEHAARIAAVAERGGTVLVGYLSGIVDESNRVRLGGYPGAFRELLGASSDEFFPLLADETLVLDGGATVSMWSESVRSPEASVIARYGSGPLSGEPAITRRAIGDGAAWYVSTLLDEDGAALLTARLVEELSLEPAADVPTGVEAVRRQGEDASWLFLVNHTDDDVEVVSSGVELLTGAAVGPRVTVPSGLVRIVREVR
ncbi:beta-galactosidase [Agromyces albus]|uniref:Beta-galactosidase n=1 Tax=Agromyces albus TaxID=205332 RepID=A0A4Q2KQC7_9MICO|nr:beta-galactosidase [Agromyces albus]RXZ67594.1 beta-galactosidase [Agromyces albus]